MKKTIRCKNEMGGWIVEGWREGWREGGREGMEEAMEGGM